MESSRRIKGVVSDIGYKLVVWIILCIIGLSITLLHPLYTFIVTGSFVTSLLALAFWGILLGVMSGIYWTSLILYILIFNK